MTRVVAGLVALIVAHNPSGSRPEEWARATIDAAHGRGLDVELLAAVVTVESRWRSRTVTPNGGGCAVGLVQYQVPRRNEPGVGRACTACRAAAVAFASCRGATCERQWRASCPATLRDRMEPEWNLRLGASVLARKRVIGATTRGRRFLAGRHWVALYNAGQGQYAGWVARAIACVRACGAAPRRCRPCRR